MFSRPRERMDTSGDGVFIPRPKMPYSFGRRPRRRMNYGRQALREVRKVKRDLDKQIELKHFTTSVAIAALVNQTAQYSSLIIIPQGDDQGERIGDKITLKSISYKLQIGIAANETGGAACRFMLIYDRRPNGAQATAAEVLNTARTYGLMNLNNTADKGRFQVLHDQVWTYSIAGKQLGFEKAYIPLKNLPVLYDAEVGDITDVQRGNLFGLFITEGNDQNISANGYIRVRYVDA